MAVDLHQFTQKQIMAIGILSQPNRAGLEFTEVAEKVGISIRQLHRWRVKPEFKQAIIEQSLINVKEVIPNVLEAHRKQAESGNIKAIELFYKLFGLLIDKQEIESVVTSKNKGNEELESELSELRGLLDELKGEE